MDSWERLACYPQGSFYPLSDGPSTRNHRITKPDFRPCSSCLTRSQALLCLYTRRAISNRAERTFGRLRYVLGGDRPSQTARLTRSCGSLRRQLELQHSQGGIPRSTPRLLTPPLPRYHFNIFIIKINSRFFHFYLTLITVILIFLVFA